MTTQYSDYVRRLEHLLEVCKNLPASLDLQPLLQTIIETSSDLTNSEFSLIYIFVKEKGFLQLAAAPFFMRKDLEAAVVPSDRSIAGRVMETGQSIVYHDLAIHDEIFKLLNWEIEQGFKSILAVPLVHKGETIGVLEAVNKAKQEPYNDEDLMFLDTLSSQAATALRNHQLIEEAEQSYIKAMELDRMKSDFIAISSHELRTPLGIIIGHVALMMEQCDPAQKKDLEVISSSANRLRDLIDQLGNIDQLSVLGGKIKRDRLDVAMLVQSVVDAQRQPALDQKILLLMKDPAQNLWVEGDADRIRIAVRNLVQNAIQFSNPGGKILVSVDQMPGYVKIAVSDNGIGIPKEEQQKIFDRFYQVERHLTRHHRGMGLGLAVAKEMVDLHRGKITVESIEGKGSRFTILLPINMAQVDAAGKVFS